MANERRFIPSNIRVRVAWALGSAAIAAAYCGIFGRGFLEWNTITSWLFISGVFLLAVAIYGAID
jgi:hypothetical protein